MLDLTDIVGFGEYRRTFRIMSDNDGFFRIRLLGGPPRANLLIATTNNEHQHSSIVTNSNSVTTMISHVQEQLTLNTNDDQA